MLQTKIKSDYNYSYGNKQDNNKVKRNRKQVSGLSAAVFISVVVVVLVVLVSYICQFVQIAHLSYEINSLENNLEEINDSNYLLNIKVAEATSLSKIEKMARNDLHMVEPEKVEVVVLNTKQDEINTRSESREDKVFFAKVFDNFMERFGTAKAKEIDE